MSYSRYCNHRTASLLLVICCISVASFGQSRHQLSPDERRHILDGQFKVISTTDGIPPGIRKAFCKNTQQQSFAMANPGEKYQVGDVIIGTHLPRRRLVFAGASGNKWFIHYERGGRGVTQFVVVFKLDAGEGVQLLWAGAGANHARSLEELRKMLAVDQFSDTDTY